MTIIICICCDATEDLFYNTLGKYIFFASGMLCAIHLTAPQCEIDI